MTGNQATPSLHILALGELTELQKQLLDYESDVALHHFVELADNTLPSEEALQHCVLIYLGDDFQVPEWMQRLLAARYCLIIGQGTQTELDIPLSPTAKPELMRRAIESAINFYLQQKRVKELEQEVALVTQERRELSAVGAALSAEKDLDRLLSMVLQEGRNLGRCEGASLYLLVRDKEKAPELVFKLTQNSRIQFAFSETRFPLTNDSLAGYVALTGETLNIPDAHQIDEQAPYRFDKRFDEQTNYRCRELLVLPMKNHKGKIIGVLQFINLISPDPEQPGFPKDTCDLLTGLASLAAVAIDNSQLIENIHQLFEGFVSASVMAIEARDPVTSGHSFRVAELTTGLAEMVDKVDRGVLRDCQFNHHEMRELRYAALLHDFGKVGVREHVLLKSNKISDERLQYLLAKIAWQKVYLEREYYRLLAETRLSKKEQSRQWQQLQAQLRQLNEFAQILNEANIPTVLEQSIACKLDEMASFYLPEEFPLENKLLNDLDYVCLTVNKGSLTEAERKEIQSHVLHTRLFLQKIPWTDELSNIPAIAGAHHEKLDGSGYPFGLTEEQIPVQSKIMTIADIYDALTASDRPYKKALPPGTALDILCADAKAGKIDSTLLDVFIQSGVYQKVTAINSSH